MNQYLIELEVNGILAKSCIVNAGSLDEANKIAESEASWWNKQGYYQHGGNSAWEDTKGVLAWLVGYNNRNFGKHKVHSVEITQSEGNKNVI